MDLVGNADSTFLGIRDISAAANVLNADFSILFEEPVVRTTLKFTAQVMEEPTPVDGDDPSGNGADGGGAGSGGSSGGVDSGTGGG